MENQFTKLGINPKIAKRLVELNFTEPTKIQALAIPELLKDIKFFVGLAQTGTGKTAAYGIPAIQTIDSKNPKPQICILSPTRELVIQISKQLFKFTKYYDPIYATAIYGGPNMDKQISYLKKDSQIIVATPGRLMDLIEKNHLDLKQIKTLILDEADEMLSMGFKKDIDKILSFTAGNSNIWLFSATMPQEIKQIVSTYMGNDYLEISIEKNELVNKKITHEYVVCHENEKLHALIQFLNKNKDERGIIFCKTKVTTDTLAKQLKSKNFLVDSLQGDLLQKEREKVMRAFKNKSVQLLVSTDVAARGIDVENLAFVCHYELPDQMEYYTHRSGRTARAGKKGRSIAFIHEGDKKHIKRIESALKITFNQTVI